MDSIHLLGYIAYELISGGLTWDFPLHVPSRIACAVRLNSDYYAVVLCHGSVIYIYGLCIYPSKVSALRTWSSKNMATKILGLLLISYLVVCPSGGKSISGKYITDLTLVHIHVQLKREAFFTELEDYVKNRTIEDNGIFVYSCEETQHHTAQHELLICVSIEQYQYTEAMERYQRLYGEYLRQGSAVQHSYRDVIRSYMYSHENGLLNGTLANFRVVQLQDFRNRTEKDPEYVAVIPSGAIVYCSFGSGPHDNAYKNTFLNNSKPLRYIIEGVYATVSFFCF